MHSPGIRCLPGPLLEGEEARQQLVEIQNGCAAIQCLHPLECASLFIEGSFKRPRQPPDEG